MPISRAEKERYLYQFLATHYSHGNASCILQGSRGQEIVIYMIQYDGDISEGKNYISYTECASGYQLKGGDCTPCSRGYYKSVVGDISCLPCPEGKVTFEDGSSKCQFCHPGHYSVNGSTACQHCGCVFKYACVLLK